MNTTTAYTPLESLLLFQSLAVSGTDPDVFIRTSTLLKSNTLIRDGDTYDPGRLSPDALRELYLQLLREELRLEASQGEGKGDASLSKKRKIQSPPLPTIKEANEYSEKLPQLVDRLYARYRDFMIRSIREDERKYESLQREMAEVERGEWDERILREDRTKPKRTPSVAAEEPKPIKPSSESPVHVTGALQENQHEETGISVSTAKDAEQPQKESPPSPAPAPQVKSKSKSLTTGDVLDSEKPTQPKDIESSAVSQLENESHVSQPVNHQRTPSHDKSHVSPTIQPIQQPPHEDWKWEQHQGVPPLQQAPPYVQFSPSQYTQYAASPPRGSFPTHLGHDSPPHGHLSSTPLNSQSHSFVAPGRAPGSPATGPLDQLADAAGQQYRSPSAAPLPPQGTAPPSQYGQSYNAYPPPYGGGEAPLSGNSSPSQWNQHYAPGFAPPPNCNYQPPPSAGQRPFSAAPSIIQSEQRQYNSPYIPSQGPRLVGTSSSSTPRPSHLRDVGLPYTPTSFGMTPNSTGRATKWTSNPTASTPKVPRSPIQPAYEPLSPVLPSALPPPMKNAKTPKSTGKSRKSEASLAETSRIKGQHSAKRKKADSPASSAVTRSLRSQSVMSHGDELSLVIDAISGSNVKQESATPKAVEDIEEITADESNKRAHGAVRASPRRALKRKRHDSPAPEPSGPPMHVLWTRNFPKISASALERIGAHRSASTFAQPIKERDAPGYSNIILRPQDLKSIRTAINAGYKSGLAVASTVGDQGQASMLLPISEDLIPPKGIVNNAQLEKELMRIFANAIMFNHDPNSGFGSAFEVARASVESTGAENYEVDENQLVNDTRAMFADVEKIVGEMRSAEWRKERGAGGDMEEDDVDELAGEAETALGSVAKRRRRA